MIYSHKTRLRRAALRRQLAELLEEVGGGDDVGAAVAHAAGGAGHARLRAARRRDRLAERLVLEVVAGADGEDDGVGDR